MLHRENKIRSYPYFSAADTIQEYMEYYNISNADLATRIGVTPEYISEFLQRKRYLTELDALRLSEVMGFSATFLLRLDSGYRMEQAKHNFAHTENPSKLFLKSYPWVYESRAE